MTQQKEQLTQELKDLITEYELGKSFNISVPLILHAKFFKFMLDSDGLLANRSAAACEAFQCLMYYGYNWRNGSKADDKLDKILRAVEKMKVVEAGQEVISKDEEEKVLDTSEGFFKQ